jgi:predicted transcriptional regulator
MSALRDRNETIAARRKGGLTLQEIAHEFGITRERVRQILLERKRSRQWQEPLNFPTGHIVEVLCTDGSVRQARWHQEKQTIVFGPVFESRPEKILVKSWRYL